MTLLTLLIALGLHYYTNTAEVLPRVSWFSNYVEMVGRKLSHFPWWGNIGGVLVLALPVSLLAALINWILKEWYFGFFSFLFSLFVLMYCMKFQNFKLKLGDYFTAVEEQDLAAAKTAAQRCFNQELDGDLIQMGHEVTKRILIHALTRCFTYIFWFVFLGPGGALFYFMISSLNASGTHNAASVVQAILEWIPVRLLALTYALVGYFHSGFNYWIRHLWQGLDFDNKLAYGAGLASLQLKSAQTAVETIAENVSVINLINNAMIVWLLVIAIFILGYWFA